MESEPINNGIKHFKDLTKEEQLQAINKLKPKQLLELDIRTNNTLYSQYISPPWILSQDNDDRGSLWANDTSNPLEPILHDIVVPDEEGGFVFWSPESGGAKGDW